MTVVPSRPARSPAPPLTFDELRRRGRDAVDEGLYEEALLIFEHALEIAKEARDADAVDLMLCNRAAVRLELEGTEGAEAELSSLRAVLGRTSNPENGWLASYQLARLHELRHDFKKALYYARLARDRAAWTRNPRWRSSALNLLGNVSLADSRVQEAMEAYREALAVLPRDEVMRRARIEANLGYCQLLTGDERHGMLRICQALRQLRRLHLHRFCAAPHLDLAYGSLELGRVQRALKHARRALELATAYGEKSTRKNALFLEGEALLRLGRHDEAERVFETLQREFYPDDPTIIYRLMAVDVLPLVNLRA